MKTHFVGDTLKATWINSGATASSIYSALFNGSETLVSSTSMSDSGGGFYYSHVTVPDTPGFYVAELKAVIDGFPYIRRVKFKATTGEVD